MNFAQGDLAGIRCVGLMLDDVVLPTSQRLLDYLNARFGQSFTLEDLYFKGRSMAALYDMSPREFEQEVFTHFYPDCSHGMGVFEGLTESLSWLSDQGITGVVFHNRYWAHREWSDTQFNLLHRSKLIPNAFFNLLGTATTLEEMADDEFNISFVDKRVVEAVLLSGVDLLIDIEPDRLVEVHAKSEGRVKTVIFTNEGQFIWTKRENLHQPFFDMNFWSTESMQVMFKSLALSDLVL